MCITFQHSKFTSPNNYSLKESMNINLVIHHVYERERFHRFTKIKYSHIYLLLMINWVTANQRQIRCVKLKCRSKFIFIMVNLFVRFVIHLSNHLSKHLGVFNSDVRTYICNGQSHLSRRYL